MNNLEYRYSNNWDHLNSVLVYKDNNFQHKSSVIILELDYCLIKPISQKKIYNTINNYSFELYDLELIDKLQKENTDKSIIILSNQINKNPLNIDIIKQKLLFITNNTNIPLLCFFALKPNCFMKPHTGLYKLLKAYYKKNNFCIQNAQIISNEGGMLIETKGTQIVGFNDTDRAFANNINIQFKSIDEYLDDSIPLPFEWNRRIIPPSIRKIYVEKILTYKNEDIIKVLNAFNKHEMYLIMIMGAPRCGKTTLAKQIITQWNNDSIGEFNAIQRLGPDEYSKKRRINIFNKLLDDRISIIIDGDCHTEQLREPFIKKAIEKSIPILYIEVNCGIEMAKVFNHSYIETNTDVNSVLYTNRLYNIYKGEYKKPTVKYSKSKFILYIPKIIESKEVMEYRY